MRYKLQMQSFIGGLPWEHDTELASDDMAKQYVEKFLTVKGALPDTCRAVVLWGLDPKERFIAEFAVETKVVVREVIRLRDRA